MNAHNDTLTATYNRNSMLSKGLALFCAVGVMAGAACGVAYDSYLPLITTAMSALGLYASAKSVGTSQANTSVVPPQESRL